MKHVSVLLLALSFLSSGAAMGANPALGGHVISGYINATNYTSTAITTQASASSLVAFVFYEASSAPTVSDSYNSSSKYSVVSLGSGANPIEESNDGIYLFAFVCTTGCVGGSSDELSVSGVDNIKLVDWVEITNSGGIDASASAYNGASSDVVNVSVTPSVSNDFIVADAATGSGAYTITADASGWTALDSVASTEAMASAYVAGASTGTYNAEMTATEEAGLAGITIAFKPTGSSSHPSQFFLGAFLYQSPVDIASLAR